ncbi:MAG: ABC transporter ATP-binding protein/permease [Lachnospiraceae bacterium]|nr:ABC transporter ATP-binding protein/permease [Lachnospiraceae bacterium]
MSKNNSLIKLWKISGKKYLFFLQFFCKIYLSLVAVYISQLARKIIDEDIFTKQPGTVLLYFTVLLLIGIGVSYLYQHCINGYAIELAYRLKNLGVERLTKCSYTSMQKEHSGTIINKFTHDISEISAYLSGGFQEAIGNMITFLCCFIYLIFVNWQMLLTCAVCIPVTLFITKRLATPTYQTMESFYQKMDEIGVLAKDTLMNQKTEKAFQLKEIRRKQFNETMDEATAQYVEYERLVSKASPVRYLLNAAPTLICIMVGFINSYFGRITSGEFVSVVLLLNYIAKPLSSFIRYVTDYKQAQVSTDRIMEILTYPLEKSGSKEGSVKSDQACYCLSDITFAYDQKTILRNLNLLIPKGKMIAIVGESGSGKSTLFQLLLGFYQPLSGSISMFGTDMTEWDLDALRSRIAYVEQTPYLFNGTVMENISAGNAKATEAEIIHAAKLAYAHEFIMELPQGYHTLLTEGGRNLSGGQRQRLAIARAFVKDAPVLLLDEMSSALDNESQRLIQLAIENYRKDKTILIIAHRLQSVVSADMIVVMDKGQIAECGTHKELLEQKGLYEKLYRIGENCEK